MLDEIAPIQIDRDKFLKLMDKAIDQRVRRLHDNLGYTAPELYAERFATLVRELKVAVGHSLILARRGFTGPEDDEELVMKEDVTPEERMTMPQPSSRPTPDQAAEKDCQERCRESIKTCGDIEQYARRRKKSARSDGETHKWDEVKADARDAAALLRRVQERIGGRP